MARSWPSRSRSLHADPCAGERVMGINQNISGLERDAGFWPLRPRSLHAGFCAGERVMGVNQNISGLRRDGSGLAIAYTQVSRPVNALKA